MERKGKKIGGYLAAVMSILSLVIQAKETGKTLKDLRK